MNIQSNNQSPNFQRLIFRKGSLEALKQCKNFQSKTVRENNESMLNFYKKLKEQKQAAGNNNMYNVVLKPDKNAGGSMGRLVIENAEGKEQTGFVTTFESLTDVETYKPKKLLSKKEEPNFVLRYFKNQSIKNSNKKMDRKAISFDRFLDIMLDRIRITIDNAEALKERSLLKTQQ